LHDCANGGFLFLRLDKQEKLHDGAGRGASILEAPGVSKFFRRFSARRVSPLAGELIFVIYSASRGTLPPLFLDFAPCKPYFSFNFISNLESLPTARWHTHKSAGIMRTLRLRVLRPLGRRRISYGAAIILFVASPRGNRVPLAIILINIHFSCAKWYIGISRTVREIKSASRFEKGLKDPWRKNTRVNVIKIWYFTKRHTMEYFICYWYWRYFMFRISWGKVLFTLALF